MPSSPVFAEAPSPTERIDAVLAKHWETRGVEAEPVVSDEVFLRRAYLTIIGRIPTIDESRDFLENESPEKRTELIDTLLDTEGFVSTQFNLWADAFRLTTEGRDGQLSGGKYFRPWLKNQLRANRPYNEWVRDVLSAEGAPWENPASSFYLRDVGMPLDNMAITMQVFLGTQLQCAQCHDHPNDQWTRRDFFEMAAFRYAINTRTAYGKIEEIQPVIEKLRESDDSEKKKNAYRLLNDAGRRLFEDYKWQNTISDRKLKYPHDYQYADAKPKSTIEPHTLFGANPESADLSGKERIEYYADWITARDNERFAKVAANRIWKSVMGIGAFEPIDDLRADTKPLAPGLDEALASILLEENFDLKEFYRIVLNSDLFQREAVVFNPEQPEDYAFTGPALRRLTAEQLWDSYAVLMDPNLDERPEDYQDQIPPPPEAVQLIEQLEPEQMIAYLEEADKAWDAMQEARRAYYNANSDPEMQGNREELDKLKKVRNEAQKKWRSYENPSNAMMMSMMGAETDIAKDPQSNKKAGHLNGIERAADLRAPESVNHFLRVFGQSDRELVDNADDGSTINQALMLLNSGETNSRLVHHADPTKRAKESKDAAEAVELMMLGFLTRAPTEREQELLVTQWEENPDTTRTQLTWALVNTREFLFLQ
ncbi:MAG: DUF1549 domain-containing protein [Puniceicoccales bacterium]